MFDGVSDDGWESDENSYRLGIRDTRLLKKKSLPADVHLPNKNEGKELRRLMSQTGLTEKELRSHYKYRKMLSKASKKAGTKSKGERLLLSTLKKVTEELKLPRSHPKVVEAFTKKINEIKNGSGYCSYYSNRSAIMHWSTHNILQKLKMI